MDAVALRAGLALFLGACLIPSSYARPDVGKADPKRTHGSAEAGLPSPDRPGPPPGKFDWIRFAGQYEFSDCQHGHGPIWDDAPPPGTFVLIENKGGFERTPGVQSLSVIRGHPSHILALGWTIENIDEALQEELDPDTGKVARVWQSYATVDGIYGARAWNHPYNKGWSTFQLRTDAAGKMTYEMRQKTDSDRVAREEVCNLTTRAVPASP